MSERTSEDQSEADVRLKRYTELLRVKPTESEAQLELRKISNKMKDKVRAGTHILNIKYGLRVAECNLCGLPKIPNYLENSCQCPKPKFVLKRK